MAKISVDAIQSLTPVQREQMFELVYESEENSSKWAFDQLDGEKLLGWFESLTQKRKNEMYAQFGRNTWTIMDFINEHWQYDRGILWRETFRRLSKAKQVEILEENYEYYEISYEKYARDSFDWGSFVCRLEAASEYSKLIMACNSWNELGVQIYACNENGMCPCLRSDTSGQVYKCFREYLRRSNSHPTDSVPMRMLQENI